MSIYFNPQPKPIRNEKIKPQGLQKKFPKTTGEKELFLKIWNKRPHVSQINEEALGDEPLTYMFMHILSKKAYPELRLDEENIVLATFDQHYFYDNGGQMPPEDVEGWKKIEKKKEELKIKANLIPKI